MTHSVCSWFDRAWAVAALLIAPLLPMEVAAQTCMGTAPFSEGAVRVGAIASYNENARSIGASLAGGKATGLFGNVSLSRLSIDAATGPSPVLVVTGGYSIDVNWPSDVLAFQLCPHVGFKAVDGPEVDLGDDLPLLDVTTDAWRGGFALGGAVFTRGFVSIVPTGSISYVSESSALRQGGSTDEVSVNYGMVDAGLGLVVRGIYTVQATVAVPFRIRGSVPRTTFGVAVGMNFGIPEY